MPFAEPSVDDVPEKARFLDSMGLSCVFSTVRGWGSLSPVRDELSTLKPAHSTMRMSAGRASPFSTSTRSPTTISVTGICSVSPSRITRAFVARNLENFFMMFAEFLFCT
eukprot:Lithocolla_globosa_v1_NODE_1120_length_2855_cov_77.670357.p6 type:complete len:110 gc:universal NODE_1120_length_2855_cov_77.670357:2032-2361(+)